MLLLTVQTHQHRVPLQLGDVNCINLLISWREENDSHHRHDFVVTCKVRTTRQWLRHTRSHLGEPGGAGV